MDFKGNSDNGFLDPFLVHIKSSGDSMAKCSSCSSDPYHCYMAASVFQNLMSDITIDAYGGFTFEVDLSVTTSPGVTPKASVNFHVCCPGNEAGACFDPPSGGHFCPLGGYSAFFASKVTTDGGSLTFGGKQKYADTNLAIDTGGGGINLGNLSSCNTKSSPTVTLKAGGGIIQVNPTWDGHDSWSYLSGFTAKGTGQMQTGGIIVNGPIDIGVPLSISPGAQINSNGYAIALASIDGSSSDPYNTIVINAGGSALDKTYFFSGSHIKIFVLQNRAI